MPSSGVTANVDALIVGRLQTICFAMAVQTGLIRGRAGTARNLVSRDGEGRGQEARFKELDPPDRACAAPRAPQPPPVLPRSSPERIHPANPTALIGGGRRFYRDQAMMQLMKVHNSTRMNEVLLWRSCSMPQPPAALAPAAAIACVLRRTHDHLQRLCQQARTWEAPP